MRVTRQILFSLLMIGGIAVLMLALAGYFKKKISSSPDGTAIAAKPFTGQVVEVRSVPWQRFETATARLIRTFLVEVPQLIRLRFHQPLLGSQLFQVLLIRRARLFVLDRFH